MTRKEINFAAGSRLTAAASYYANKMETLCDLFGCPVIVGDHTVEVVTLHLRFNPG